MYKRKRNNVFEIKKVKNVKLEEVVRCDWVNKDPAYVAYHDNEWGQPEFDSRSLFEMLCLGGQQAGLSWLTVLKKRDNYKLLFHNFNPLEISQMNSNDVHRLLCDSRLIKNRGKLESIIHNSKCYLKMKEENIDFSKFVWSFVENTPIINSWKNSKEVPTKTEASAALAVALKKRGFKYVGSTICYAFMQTCGLVNDHVTSCICYSKVSEKRHL